MDDQTPQPRCRCGHYQREHSTTDLGPIGIGGRTLLSVFCTGATWASPDDAEDDHDTIEVPCQCSGFDRADEDPRG